MSTWQSQPERDWFPPNRLGDRLFRKALHEWRGQKRRGAGKRLDDRPNKHEREAPPTGGTFNSTAYKAQRKPDGSTHHGFNSGPIDGAWHGHVIEEADGTYRYVRDADGMEYDV